MRKQIKRLIAGVNQAGTEAIDDWLELRDLADVEISSEHPEHPIESALLPGPGVGWRAAEPGEQTIRLLFARPLRLRRIRLEFVETRAERTQEYVLRWSPDGGQPLRELVRQQWNFSPQGATHETENHYVDLPAVAVLELSIVADVRGGNAAASLARLRLA